MNKDLRKRKREEEDEEDEDEEFPTKIFQRNVETDQDGEKDSNNSSVSLSGSDDDESPVDKFRRGCDLPSDLDMGDGDNSADSSNNDDCEDDGDWNMMGAALEREFLGLDWLNRIFYVTKIHPQTNNIGHPFISDSKHRIDPFQRFIHLSKNVNLFIKFLWMKVL